MIKPNIPIDEEDRLKALIEYSILDTLEEKEYDDLTNIAAMICNTPMATISLIDSEQQFIKSKIGPFNTVSTREISFCSHTINYKSELTIVKDAREDVRFQNNPSVLGSPNIVFYAGAPLISPEGYAIGSLCVIDQKPRELNEDQKSALKALANQVILLLELRKNNQLLASAHTKIDEHARQMEHFAYMAAHDLKEPLRMISSFLNLLFIKYGEKLDDKANKYIHFAVDGSIRMAKLIDEILNYARINLEDFPSKPINLNLLIQEIVSLNIGPSSTIKSEVKYSGLPTIIGKETAIKIVFENLISNAMKYSSKTRPLEIKIQSEDHDTYWLFKVSDNGIGIDKNYFDNIFKIFERADSKPEYLGTGLGLSICKKIIEQHGGEIWVESELGEGSTFLFTLKKTK